MEKSYPAGVGIDQSRYTRPLPQPPIREDVHVRVEEVSQTRRHDPIIDEKKSQYLTLKDILSGGVQIISLFTAIIFGVWAIRSYDAAVKANSIAKGALYQGITALQQGRTSNQLALLAICTASEVCCRIRFSRYYPLFIQSSNWLPVQEFRNTDLCSLVNEIDLLSISRQVIPSVGDFFIDDGGESSIFKDPVKILFIVAGSMIGALLLMVFSRIVASLATKRGTH
jgi:hypothetical protein